MNDLKINVFFDKYFYLMNLLTYPCLLVKIRKVLNVWLVGEKVRKSVT